jgi:sugar lactone lactonase YvrE
MNFPRLHASAGIARRSAILLAGLLLAAGASHDDDGTGPAPTGTVAGTITSSLGGAMSGVSISVAPSSGTAPAQVTTDGDGEFSISGVPVADGKGTISLAELPDNCTDPGAISYSGLANGQTVTKDIQVDCDPLTGTVAGTVTSSLGGPLQDVHVSVDPDGDAPPVEVATDADGKYSIAGVPVGSGSVSLSGVPDNCSVPAASAYDGLTGGSTKTVDVTVPCDATTGALTVNVAGVVDFDASVQVTGPNSYSTVVTKTTTLTDLEPGSYTVVGAPVVVDDPVVVSRYVAATAGSPKTVVVGDTVSVNVTYAIRTGSGGLWFTNIGNGRIARFAAGQLHATGSPVDTTSIVGPGSPFGAAFDSAGNLWVAGKTGDKLVAYSREQLVAGGTPVPLTSITGFMDAPDAIAFDDDGTLWVASSGNNSIFGYSAAQVKAGGSPTPAITITSADLQTPVALAFDADGDLWVANSGAASFAEFSASQLATGGNISANVKLTASSGVATPSGLAFDADGNLWIANSDPIGTTSGVVAFTAAQLASSATLAPAIAVLFQNPALTGGVAFDESGSLWVSNAGANALYKYSADQLASSGTPTPAATISLGTGGSLDLPAALVFDPHAEGLPIRW